MINYLRAGLLLENGVYLAMVTPEIEHANLYAKMKKANQEDGWVAYHLDSGEALEYAYADGTQGYTIYNLQQVASSRYSAVLALKTHGFFDELGGRKNPGIVYIPVLEDENAWGCFVREIVVSDAVE